MRKVIFIFILVGFVATAVRAQDFDRFFSVSWQGNMATDEWIDNTSGKGMRIGFRKMINDRFAYGLDVSWAAYERYVPRGTYYFDTRAITTDYFNDLYAYEIMLGGQYFLPTGWGRVMPFAGLGAGAALNRYVQSYNVYADREDTWGFAVRPELGVMFPFGGKVGAIISGNYTFTTAGSEFFEVDNFAHLGVNVGLIFTSY